MQEIGSAKHWNAKGAYRTYHAKNDPSFPVREGIQCQEIFNA
jgi:hypothetical protein